MNTIEDLGRRAKETGAWQSSCHFGILRGDDSTESRLIWHLKYLRDFRFSVFDKDSEITEEEKSNIIPVGSVEFCQRFLKNKVVLDQYPEFLQKFFKRKIYKVDLLSESGLAFVRNPPSQNSFFIKPADEYKRFEGFLCEGCDLVNIIYLGEVYVSEKIPEIENEFRYYVSYGKVVYSAWYDGRDEMDAPILNFKFPKDFCGAVDFGVSKGQIFLIESHHPYACGWYGDSQTMDKFLEWTVQGWQYMRGLDENLS